MERVAPLARAEHGGGDVHRGERGGAQEERLADGHERAAVVLRERDRGERAGREERVRDEVVEVLRGERVELEERGGGGRGEEAVLRGGAERLEADVADVGAGDHLLEEALVGVLPAPGRSAVEVGARGAVERAALDVHDHRAGGIQAGDLGDAGVALDVGDVGAGAEDEADVGRVAAREAGGLAGEERRGGVVEDAQREAAAGLREERLGDAGADLLADDLGRVDLLGPADEAAVEVREDLGRVGEAEAGGVRALADGLEEAGERVEEVLGGERGAVRGGHAVPAEVLHACLAGPVEPDDGDAQVGAAGVEDDDGRVG